MFHVLGVAPAFEILTQMMENVPPWATPQATPGKYLQLGMENHHKDGKTHSHSESKGQAQEES